MLVIQYDRSAAVSYAERWALSRNPEYYNFDALGGDCTNFVSQCLFAGCGVMNWSAENGWYYAGLNDRAPAWTGVNELGEFLLHNAGYGPFAQVVPRRLVKPGDIIQLGNEEGRYYHSLFVLSAAYNRIYIAAHSYDALWRALNTYHFAAMRCLHIVKARVP